MHYAKHCASFSISPSDLWTSIGSPNAPQIIDVRRREIYDAAPGVLPTATWRDFAKVEEWAGDLDRGHPVVLSCKQGKELSQAPAAWLRGEGFQASILEGGYAAWSDASLPLVNRETLARFASKQPSLWVTRRRPKIDRVACPWLIRRFIDRTGPLSLCRSGACVARLQRKPARCRSTSRASRFPTMDRAAASTPCSSCSGWKTSPPSPASR